MLLGPPPEDETPAPAPVVEWPPTRGAVVLATGLVVAVILYVGGTVLTKSYDASFFAIPFFVGLVVGMVSSRRPFRNAFGALGLSVLLLLVTLREGVICILFSLPLVIPELMLGALAGHVLRRWVRSRRRQRQGVGAILLLALCWQAVAGRLDQPGRHPVQEARSAVTIAASPERVFAALTEARLEVPSRWPWFLTIGLPIPRALEIDRPGPAGTVRIQMSHGIAHGHVTSWLPPTGADDGQLAFALDRYEIEDLPFHITRLGRGPHYGLRTERMEDWLTFLDLHYTVERAPRGGTRLLRTSSWRRHLAPAFYFAWLQQKVVERGQQRLLELVKERVEVGGGLVAPPPSLARRDPGFGKMP